MKDQPGTHQFQQSEVEKPEEKEFHQRDGWYFRRMEDGAVRIRHGIVSHVIPAEEWVSVVASMSRAGETSETYRFVQDFHAGT